MITDLLIALYPWIKAFHIMAVISWMAGLFYLPRLFVYHSEQGHTDDGAVHHVFQIMEDKLLRLIMTPAMIVTWCLGLMLVAIPGRVDWTAAWPYSKLVSVLAMTWFHFWLAARRKEFASGSNVRSGKCYRMMNEVPTVLMIIIVLSVVVRF